ncbi:MAG: phosphoribosyl-ATP pyrophosphohydrolase [Promethearchaeota archaeon]
MPVYNKAVRDKIPEIITKSGSKPQYRILDNEKFLPYLEKKLHEELEEYDASKSIIELADLIEVIYRIAELRNVTVEELELIRNEKRIEKGGFDKNIYLLDTNRNVKSE